MARTSARIPRSHQLSKVSRFGMDYARQNELRASPSKAHLPENKNQLRVASFFFAASGRYSRISPGWHSSVSEIASSAEKRMTLALPVLRMDRFCGVMSTTSVRSFNRISGLYISYNLLLFSLFYGRSALQKTGETAGELFHCAQKGR